MLGINNMKNSNELEKSRGVVLFAFNSSTVNYVSIAELAAQLITKHLNLPVTLITDSATNYAFDHVITVSSLDGNSRRTLAGRIIDWKNFDRFKVYEYSPYDETILLDVDYLVFDDSLLKLWHQPFDYRLQYHMQTPEGLNKDEMGPMSLPMVWATTVLFRKSESTKLFFDLIGRIQRNYGYYKNLFAVRDDSYRNDFAFSMANIILNGYAIAPEQSVPWPLFTIEKNIESIEQRNKFFVVRYKESADVIPHQNLHIMDKKFLQSHQFKSFITAYCNE